MKKICLLFLTIFSVGVLLAQPANDDPCNAIALEIGADCSTSLPYTNVGATALSGEGFACYPDGSADNTVWFTFVPTMGSVSISTDFGAVADSSDTQLTVYELSGSDCSIIANFNALYCNEDILPAPVNSYFNAGLPPVAVNPGSTYYIQVDAFNNDTEAAEPDTNPGSFCILVSEFNPPSNDECANAVPFGGFGPASCKVAGDLPALQGNLTTIGATATTSLDSLACDSDGLNATVYYSFPFGQDPTAEIEFQLLAGENVNVAVVEPGCDTSPGVASNNCVTGLTAVDDGTVTSVNAALFSGLDAGATYNLVIWTNEGDETDFDFCMIKRPEGYYECGDNVCYDLAESYSNCEDDCPCVSNIDLVSLITGAVSDVPTGVCAEIIGGTSDSANPGIYIPFQVNTLDSDLSGSSVTSTQGSIFTSNSDLNFFGYATNPLIPLPNDESDGFLNFLFLTQAEIDAGGTVTINFTSDAGACSASIDFNLADLQGASSSDCGNCNLVLTPDYSTLQCPNFAIALDIEGAIGDLWLSQNNTIVFDQGDIPIPYSGGYPNNDFTLTAYDSGQPNCAFPTTITFGDYFCDPDGEPGTFCRLEPSVDANSSAICDDATGNILVPIDFVNHVTGAITSTPNIITGSGEDGPYYASIDPNNCSAIDITVSDESDVDAFSGTPIFNISSPASIAGGIANVGTNDGDVWGLYIDSLGVCPSGGVSGSIVLVDDGSDTSTEFCNPDGGTPTADQCTGVAGNIAMVDRGSCTFVNKASNAQQCGAIAVIICNNDTANPDDVIPMGGAATPPITIPSIMLSFNDCAMVKAELSGGVQACIGAPQTVPGCERTFTLDVCADYSVSACDDADCSTENDVATVGPNGEICACAGTPIVCAEGETFNTESCACESDDVMGCTDMCATNFNVEATVDDGSCTLPDCDDGCDLTTDSLDTTTCDCVNTPPDPNDGCDLTTDSFDAATCAIVNAGPDPDDGCDLTTDSFDIATCAIVNAAPDPNDGCDLTTDSFDLATCAIINEGPDPDDGCDLTSDSFDLAACAIVNTPPDPSDGCDLTTDSFDAATCAIVNEGPDPDDGCDLTTDSFDAAACAIVNEAPPVDDGCDLTTDSFDAATCAVVNAAPDPNDNCDLTTDSFDAATCVIINESTCPDGNSLDEVNCVCVEIPVPGCTDMCATNYNVDANQDDGSCMLPDCDDGCDLTEDSLNSATCECFNVAPDPNDGCDLTTDTFDFGTCTIINEAPDPSDGCDLTTDSFDAAACAIVNAAPDPNDGCDLTADSFDAATCAVVNEASCPEGQTFNATSCACDTDPVPGCTDACAPNYNELANTDDGTCEDYSTDCNTDCTAGAFNGTWDVATCACINETAPVNGCTDATATNFNAEANCDDSTCTFDMCEDPCAPNFGSTDACEEYDLTCNEDCTAGPFGGTWDAATCACVNETAPVSGCTDETATNFNAEANCDDSSCMFMMEVMGCNDMAACNYDVAANVDDGSCVYAVAGSISTTGPNSICVDDDVDEPIDVTVDDAGQGSNGAWVITDENAMILALPDAPPFVLDGAGVGTCLIWWVNFSDDTFAPAVGDDAAALVGASSCAALSNSIAINRVECGTTECTPPSAGDFNCDE